MKTQTKTQTPTLHRQPHTITECEQCGEAGSLSVLTINNEPRFLCLSCRHARYQSRLDHETKQLDSQAAQSLEEHGLVLTEIDRARQALARRRAAFVAQVRAAQERRAA